MSEDLVDKYDELHLKNTELEMNLSWARVLLTKHHNWRLEHRAGADRYGLTDLGKKTGLLLDCIIEMQKERGEDREEEDE